MVEWANTRITDGTAQADRIAPALQVDDFNVDELLFEELLAMAAEIAAEIRFYNLNNQINGNWADLFSMDEAVIMSMILSTDLKRAEAEFLHFYTDHTEERLARLVLQWAGKINFWLMRLSRVQHRSGMSLRQKIHALVEEKLANELQTICGVMDQLAQDKGSGEQADLSQFGPVWGITREGERFVYSRLTGEVADEGQRKQQLRTAFYAFRKAITNLKHLVPAYLQDSLSSQQHASATGLFMVFLKLYEKAQQKINQFTQRHLDFYYHQVLEARPRTQRPESVYLRFTTKPGTESALIQKATEFTAGKDESLKEIVYRAENDLLVGDARIKALRTLHLQHDNLISPETELDYVTRIKTASPPMPEPGETQPSSSWHLFGADRRGSGGDDAEIGFALASPLLLLQEGVRRIELSLYLEDRGSSNADDMISRLSDSTSRAAFRQQFGKILSRYLLCGRSWLSEENRRRINAKAEALLEEGSVSLLDQDWQGLFYRLLKNAFNIRLSVEMGWLEISDYVIAPLNQGKMTHGTGIKIIFTLGQEVPPIVPAIEATLADLFPAELPLLSCCINPQTNFYPYTLFEALCIEKMIIDVDVKGVRNTLAYNNHGQLDPSKPFQPFGPFPTCSSYLVVGNYEIAGKRLTDLKLNLEWGELPFNSGGFAEYYRNYAGDYGDRSFKGRFEALVDGEWRAREGDRAQPVCLFDSERVDGGLRRERVFDVDLFDDLKPIDSRLNEEEFSYSLKMRNGFFRLALVEPATAFGHTVYPELLTRVLTQNARLKKPLDTPNQPYTPNINRISLDYRARAEINPLLDGSVADGVSADALFHIHPFGVEALYPGAQDKPLYLLPQYAYQGNLFIGIEANDLSGALTLFFYLTDDVVRQYSDKDPEIAWFYLAGDSWRQLSADRIHLDTTAGFLSSGIVTLDIPADMERSDRIMPGELYWLRVSARKDLHGFCSCYAIQPHAVKLTRVLHDRHSAIARPPAAGKWQPMATIPGIDGIYQAGQPFAGRIKESRSELTTRLAERLRHKNRALTAWDYERLVLERFPQLAKVKCFSHMTSTSKTPRPGHVLIVVVPKFDSAVTAACEKLMVSSLELHGIKEFVQGLATPFLRIEVRNPVYEQVQVRCTVRFSGGFKSGFYFNRLDHDISNFICPWRETGYRARFGWSIRQKDIESYIRGLDYVEFSTDFSMLHITQDNAGCYSLGDTARDRQDAKVVIGPRYPWSLAVPARQHYIEATTSARPIEPQVTGIDELEIGNTFIIIGNSGYGEKE